MSRSLNKRPHNNSDRITRSARADHCPRNETSNTKKKRKGKKEKKRKSKWNATRRSANNGQDWRESLNSRVRCDFAFTFRAWSRASTLYWKEAGDVSMTSSVRGTRMTALVHGPFSRKNPTMFKGERWMTSMRNFCWVVETLAAPKWAAESKQQQRTKNTHGYMSKERISFSNYSRRMSCTAWPEVPKLHRVCCDS